MPPPVSRRVRPATAVTRGASSRTPPRQVEERSHGFVSTKMSDRQGTYYEDNKEVEVLRQKFSEESPAAFVRVGAGLTINMDNYESLRIDCAVTIPCRPDSLDEAYQIASDFVADKISEEQTNWLGSDDKFKGKAR